MLLILLAPASRFQALSGLAIVVVGIPVYYLWRAVEGKSAASSASA
jgi:hypothetical protein